MPGLKDFDEVLDVDTASASFGIFDREVGGVRSIEFKDHYEVISDIALTGRPSEKVERHFDLARNLFLYSWFVYNFTTPAMAQAYGSVEMALRERFKTSSHDMHPRTGLRKMFKKAVALGWVRDGGFPHIFKTYEEPLPLGLTVKEFDPDGTEYCEQLLDALPKMRNTIAHGTSMLLTPGMALMPLEICARVIDQLFPGERRQKFGVKR